MIETAEKMGVPLASVEKALVGGGPLFPQLRQFYKDRGIQCLQSFATAELGNIAYESPALEGLTVAEDKIELNKPEQTTASGTPAEARRVEVSLM